MEKLNHPITPHLWFDKEAKEATELYTTVFPDSRVDFIRTITGTPSGDCDVVSFTLGGVFTSCFLSRIPVTLVSSARI